MAIKHELIQIIISNKAQCRNCQQIIESKHVHDYVSCKCKAISVDGGHEYLRRRFTTSDELIELSETLNIEQSRYTELLNELKKQRNAMTSAPQVREIFLGMRKFAELLGIRL